MNFCSHCGNPVSLAIPAGDTLPRYSCTQCGTIHYQNPKMVIGCIAEWEGKILRCRRAIEPRHGLWTLPAGFMENNETTAEAAARETMEEACAEVEIDRLFALINVPHIHQVHMFYTARLIGGRFGVGVESLESRLFEEASLPWEEMAFRSVSFALQAWLSDRKKGEFGLHTVDLPPMPPTPLTPPTPQG
ncbi:MAG: NUDIX hydrolase [Betaproteobacteria bacterium]|uniref:NUDIX hydrolase n=1 Tax=Candidatus Proximibacter danicus TaxID=2954365 RepID=A0A9D7JYM0_9PROT|nr:NUDIX hydrolase [Candidatus Proximibacter danicus]